MIAKHRTQSALLGWSLQLVLIKCQMSNKCQTPKPPIFFFCYILLDEAVPRYGWVPLTVRFWTGVHKLVTPVLKPLLLWGMYSSHPEVSTALPALHNAEIEPLSYGHSTLGLLCLSAFPSRDHIVRRRPDWTTYWTCLQVFTDIFNIHLKSKCPLATRVLLPKKPNPACMNDFFHDPSGHRVFWATYYKTHKAVLITALLLVPELKTYMESQLTYEKQPPD